MNRLIIFISFILSFNIFANIRDFHTTRMLSLSGAGVGSVNMIDAMTQNPAASGLYQGSLLYAQAKKSNNSDQASAPQNAEDPSGFMVAVTDATNKSKGGFMAQKYKEQNFERLRFGGNMASAISRNSSMGVTYLYTKDENLLNQVNEKFHSVNLGYSQILGAGTSMGLTLNNVNNARQRDSKVTVGSQFSFSPELAILADYGFDYRKNRKNTDFYRLAAQATVYKSLLLRGGMHNDKMENTKGYSFGVAWVAPKMSIEAGYQDSKLRDESKNSILISKGDSLKEMTAAIVFKLK